MFARVAFVQEKFKERFENESLVSISGSKKPISRERGRSETVSLALIHAIQLVVLLKLSAWIEINK